MYDSIIMYPPSIKIQGSGEQINFRVNAFYFPKVSSPTGINTLKNSQ